MKFLLVLILFVFSVTSYAQNLDNAELTCFDGRGGPSDGSSIVVKDGVIEIVLKLGNTPWSDPKLVLIKKSLEDIKYSSYTDSYDIVPFSGPDFVDDGSSTNVDMLSGLKVSFFPEKRQVFVSFLSGDNGTTSYIYCRYQEFNL